MPSPVGIGRFANGNQVDLSGLPRSGSRRVLDLAVPLIVIPFPIGICSST